MNFNSYITFSGNVTYVFAIVARDTDGRDVTGPLSNIATVSMENLLPDPLPSNAEENNSNTKLSSYDIILLTIGGVFAIIACSIVVAMVALEPCNKSPKQRYREYSKKPKKVYKSRPRSMDQHRASWIKRTPYDVYSPYV